MRKDKYVALVGTILLLFSMLIKVILTAWLSSLAITIIAGTLYAMSCLVALFGLAALFAVSAVQDEAAWNDEESTLSKTILRILFWPFVAMYRFIDDPIGYIGAVVLFITVC